MSKQTKSLPQIGADLLAAAQSRTESPLPKSTELFPYLLIASRSMSMREISDWLDKKHGVKLSAASVSRALGQPNLHLQRLADSISARARYLALVVKTTPRDLLHWPDNAPSNLEQLILDHPRPSTEDEINLVEHANELLETWRSIPHEARLLIEPLLDFETDHDPDADLYERFTTKSNEH